MIAASPFMVLSAGLYHCDAPEIMQSRPTETPQSGDPQALYIVPGPCQSL